MIQDYLIGELSVRLEQLQTAAAPAAARRVASLRHDVETGPPGGLATAMAHALAVADDLCWESLAHGDTTAFSRQAGASAELRQFGTCARLLTDG
jgi:hypothetical protein